MRTSQADNGQFIVAETVYACSMRRMQIKSHCIPHISPSGRLFRCIKHSTGRYLIIADKKKTIHVP